YRRPRGPGRGRRDRPPLRLPPLDDAVPDVLSRASPPRGLADRCGAEYVSPRVDVCLLWRRSGPPLGAASQGDGAARCGHRWGGLAVGEDDDARRGASVAERIHIGPPQHVPGIVGPRPEDEELLLQ